jgi:mRNA interferase MazF
MAYIPDRGDIVWLNFKPHAGHEQKGRRPALVLSPKSYNGKVGLLIACPITSRKKGYPFEVELPENLPVKGAVLSDHVKSLDWRARKAERIGVFPLPLYAEVLGKLNALLAVE